MATKKQATTIPMMDDLTRRVGRIRKDVERTVERVRREATRYLPEQGRRQLDVLVDRVSELSGTVTKTVDNVYADVEVRVSDLRGSVEKQVKALRKDTTSVSQKALTQIEKEARRQIERLLKNLGVLQRSDLDGLKRRISAIERKLDELAKEVQEAA
ncbi:MAG TPA: hypothetical protein VEC57_03825 [Candidatus Limnocylindrales bacterium]|nr:hypothetical protein [Candidatus Limnocylindrales bacterium]